MISQRVSELATFCLTSLLVVAMFCVAGSNPALAQEASRANGIRDEQISSNRPRVLGHGQGLYTVGRLIAQDVFENLEDWVVQIQQKTKQEDRFEPARVVARDHAMDCYLPGRGCTAWFKKKLPTRVTITYDVLCPTHSPEVAGMSPTDVNNFWMASDASNTNSAELGLFDSSRYTGEFGSYDKLHCYYASTGGRKNSSTRMRRYPRKIDGKPTEHIALDDKDGRLGYLIVPDTVMRVQLVAYDDVVQYIVDGKLIYQMAGGDAIHVEGRNDQGKPSQRESVYDLDRFPVYREGYFGLRMFQGACLGASQGWATAPDRTR